MQSLNRVCQVFEFWNFILVCVIYIALICDWIYGNRSELHIGSYEIINFKDFKAL